MGLPAQSISSDYAQYVIEANPAEIQALQRLGITLDHLHPADLHSVQDHKAHSPTASRYEIALSSYEAQLLENQEIVAFRRLSDDMTADYVQRNLRDRQRTRTHSGNASTINTPAGFNLGSMGGFLTYAEIFRELDSMRISYPNLVSENDTIGFSVEGRPIVAVKISDNPQFNEPEPEVLYAALHHAREPISVMQMIYYMQHLLENYGSDQRVTHLVNEREMYFVPILNPDGYVYNQVTSPNGGGMWRKNRRNNGNGSYGVDLNRNYGYEWGHDNMGSSNDPFSDAYRGPQPFSEPETMAMRGYCLDHGFKTALSYHAYGNYALRPWGYDESAPLQDLDRYEKFGHVITADNHYQAGTPFQTVGYLGNGVSDDWMYGEQVDKDKIFSFTPEVGSSSDGFWPVPSRIVPLCEEQIEMNLEAACLAGACMDVQPEVPCELEGPTLNLPVRFENLGLSDGDAFSSEFLSNDPQIAAILTPVRNISAVAEGSDARDSFAISMVSNVSIGSVIRGLIRTTLPGNIVVEDSVKFVYGMPDILFQDTVASIPLNWVGTWASTSERAWTGMHSITDSPFMNYSNSSTTHFSTVHAIDLTDYDQAMLRFHATWELEENWDYVQVMVSTDGTNFTPLRGPHSEDGAGSWQPSGEPLYDGIETDWVFEKIDLTDYVGQSVYIRFRLESNFLSPRDGFYFDELLVTGYKNNVAVEPPAAFASWQLLPNPSNGSVRVQARDADLEQPELVVYSMLGREVLRIAAVPGMQLDMTPLGAGAYLYHFKNSDHRGEFHKMLLR